MSLIRKRMLPQGWYPKSASAVEERLQSWAGIESGVKEDAVSCIVPHAGWGFSGELAFAALRRLVQPLDTIAVIGGHLPARPSLLITKADRFETPLGYLESDTRMLRRLCDEMEYREDTGPDNTVEVQLPLIKYLFPDVQVVAVRISPTAEAAALGKRVHELAGELGRRMAVVGSTDLTHYGPAYGFSPAGTGEKAVNWVREENDKEFIDLSLSMDAAGAVNHANTHHSACSAGAAAAAISFAGEAGAAKGHLIGHRLSSDIAAADSFVGYGAIVFS